MIIFFSFFAIFSKPIRSIFEKYKLKKKLRKFQKKISKSKRKETQILCCFFNFLHFSLFVSLISFYHTLSSLYFGLNIALVSFFICPSILYFFFLICFYFFISPQTAFSNDFPQLFISCQNKSLNINPS